MIVKVKIFMEIIFGILIILFFVFLLSYIPYSINEAKENTESGHFTF
jgi:hypothetical protein